MTTNIQKIFFLVLTIFFLIIFVVLTPKTQIIYPQIESVINEPIVEYTPKEINILNLEISQIKSIFCNLKISEKIAINCVLYAEDKNLRIKANYLSPELDVGINNKNFWIWFKRYKNVMYYGESCNVNSVGIKPEFSPFWIRKILNLDPINGDFRQKDDKLFVTQYLDNNLYLTTIQNGYPIEHSLFSNGELVINAKIEQNSGIIPTKIRVFLKETNSISIWEIINYKVNNKIPNTAFQMPMYKNIFKLD